MKKKVLVSMVALLLAISLIVGCAAPAPPAPAPTPAPAPAPAPVPVPTPELPKITWKFSSSYSASDPFHSRIFNPTFERVYELTDGGLEIVNYPGGELQIKPADALYLVKEGTPPAVEFFAARFTGVVPAFAVIHLPFLILDDVEAEAVLFAVRPIYERYLAENWNAKFIFACPNSLYAIAWSKVPIRNAEEFKGKKLRVYSSTHADVLVEAGAVPVNLAMAEVYGALQRGMIEGAITTPSTALADHYYEVLNYGIQVPLKAQTDGSGLLVNMDAFNALPKKYQDALMQAGQEIMEKSYDIAREVEEANNSQLRKNGIEFIEWSAEEKAKMAEFGAPVWDSTVKQGGPLAEEIMAVIQKTLKEVRARR